MKAELYYDRSFRSWVYFLTDDAGIQIGPCDYAYSKDEARANADALLASAIKYAQAVDRALHGTDFEFRQELQRVLERENGV